MLNPGSSDKAEFDRMNTLANQGIYTVSQDRGGRAIYTLADLGNAHNVRAQGSGVTNPGVDTSARQPVDNFHPYSGVSEDPVLDNYVAGLGTEGGRGDVVEQPGAREDYNTFGPTTGAPAVTPEGRTIKYIAGQVYQVETKAQAMQWIAEGIVAPGAKFMTADGIEGVAQ